VFGPRSVPPQSPGGGHTSLTTAPPSTYAHEGNAAPMGRDDTGTPAEASPPPLELELELEHATAHSAANQPAAVAPARASEGLDALTD
jgi:hypothetical protein